MSRVEEFTIVGLSVYIAIMMNLFLGPQARALKHKYKFIFFLPCSHETYEIDWKDWLKRMIVDR